MERPMTPVPIQPTRVFDGFMSSAEAMKCRTAEECWWIRRRRKRRFSSRVGSGMSVLLLATYISVIFSCPIILSCNLCCLVSLRNFTFYFYFIFQLKENLVLFEFDSPT